MIPSTTNRLLITEDWKKIYQSYRNAEFESYDFETLRRTMITYLRENYPEDFNDYIDSSEYIALIDLIAYLGQNLSFRVDLNARENFIETAERRDSILRLAKLIGYNATRNTPASGFLKITDISTTDNVLDTNGTNLANQIVSWNDPTNTNWYQQFISIMNSAMPSSFIFGRPYDKATIGGIDHQQYRINTSNIDVPLFAFSSNVNGTSMNFEIAPCMFAGSSSVYEDPPRPGNLFSLIYKNDNRGNASSNTGFFVHFRQGSTAASDFSISQPVPNELIAINASNTNNSDVWLWQLDSAGNYTKLWTKVNDLIGNNVIYNSISNQVRTVYSVLTRDQDQFDLSFSDGDFGDLPQGAFGLYYRQSNGLNYVIKPDQMSNITVTMPYYNKAGQPHNLRIVLNLQETVSNSSASESNANIKLKAPQTYYVQNRMVTGEDYNIAPLSAAGDILKLKSINRISSGISKYYELSDVSGQYSNTNIFANDGMLYKKYTTENFEFSFVDQNEILGVLDNQVSTIVASPSSRSFYIDQYDRVDSSGLAASWVQAQSITNITTGYFIIDSTPVTVGGFSENALKYVTAGALIKFVAPTGRYFLPNNTLTATPGTDTKDYFWSKVVAIAGDGSNSGQGLLASGQGPITLTNKIPTGAIPTEIIPAFNNVISDSIKAAIAAGALAKRNMGLSFDTLTRSWFIISDSNLDISGPFSLSYQKDISNVGKDSSWMISFEWTGRVYKVRYRGLDYVFESVAETAFFVDDTAKNYDFVNNTVIKDQIKVLSVNESLAEASHPVKAIDNTVPFIVGTVNGTTTPGVALTARQLKFDSKWLSTSTITAYNYSAIHPFITGGMSTVTSVGTNTVTIAAQLTTVVSNVPQTIPAVVPATPYVTFVPNTVRSVYTLTLTPAELHSSVSLSKDYIWQIDGAMIETDGYISPGRVKVSQFDSDNDGQIDDPDSFDRVVLPDSVSAQTQFKDKFVFFKLMADGETYKVYSDPILAFPTEQDAVTWFASQGTAPTNGQLIYFYAPSIAVVKSWSTAESTYVLEPDYAAYSGRLGLKFHYLHNSSRDKRIDPGKTNLIDIYLLTNSYDASYRNWLATRSGSEPLPPTSSSLESQFAASLNSIKSISDELVFQPATYKILFGNLAAPTLQGTFKAVKNSGRTNSDNDLKTRILIAIEEFFNIENWEFGQTFHFSELSTYVMNKLTPDITNFVIVPSSSGSFGSLFEVTCQSNEIFINGATVNDINIIDAVTASELKSISSVVSNTTGG